VLVVLLSHLQWRQQFLETSYVNFIDYLVPAVRPCQQQHMKTNGNGWIWVRNVATPFLCVSGLALALSWARAAPPAAVTPGSSAWLPPSMHEAQAGVDVGPGSDEAFLVRSPTTD
jgi:hypothetical protein